jgi:hypothetical protein
MSRCNGCPSTRQANERAVIWWTGEAEDSCGFLGLPQAVRNFLHPTFFLEALITKRYGLFMRESKGFTLLSRVGRA